MGISLAATRNPRYFPEKQQLHGGTWWGFGRASKDNAEADLRSALEGAAQAPGVDVHQTNEEVAAQEAAGQPDIVRLNLISYLDQVPASIHQSQRRPSDPSGTTIPSSRSLKKPEDLLPFMPTGLPRFKPGDRPLAADWELVELLGKGGFGEVWKARHLTRSSKKPVALKFCLDSAGAASLLNEVALHKELDRVRQQGGAYGIVPLLDTFLKADPPCLMYEYVEGGDLAGLIQERHPKGKLTEVDDLPAWVVAQHRVLDIHNSGQGQQKVARRHPRPHRAQILRVNITPFQAPLRGRGGDGTRGGGWQA